MACCWFGSWRLVVCQSVSFGQRGVCTENRAYFSASWSRLASAGKKNPSRPSISSFHFLPSSSRLGNFARGSIPQTPCSRIARSKTTEYHHLSVEWTVLGNFRNSKNLQHSKSSSLVQCRTFADISHRLYLAASFAIFRGIDLRQVFALVNFSRRRRVIDAFLRK